MKTTDSDTVVMKKTPPATLAGGSRTRNDDMVRKLRAEQDELNRQLPNNLSQDSEEIQATILDDYFRNSFGVSEAGFKLDLINNPYAIIATGSYGRKEICRNPVISILFIFKNMIPDGAVGLIREIVYPLWDLGFNINYSTKTVKDCVSTATRDYGTLTSLIDSRFICGVSPLYSRLMSQIREKIVFNRKKDILAFLLDRDETRHRDFGGPEFMLEPDLVSSPGGLKDYHVMVSAARIVLGVMEPREIETNGLLSTDEYLAMNVSLSFIRKVLRLIRPHPGISGTRLVLKSQHDVARLMGFRNTKITNAVDLFLSDLEKHMNTLRTVRSRFFLSLAPERITGTSGPEGESRTDVKWLNISRGMVQVTSSVKLLKHPTLLLSTFHVAETAGAPVSPETLRLVTEFLGLVTDPFISTPPVMDLFEKILFESAPESRIPGLMHETGLLGAFIPEFNPISHVRQFGIHPMPPVSAHLLRTVARLKELITVSGSDLSPEHRLVLLWAGLLHAVGRKETTPDDGKSGAALTRSILRRLGKPNGFIDLTAFLVEHHALMHRMVLSEDIQSEKTWSQVCGIADTPLKLFLLLLLTLAGLKAGGPGCAPPFKEEDLRRLHGYCAAMLSGNPPEPPLSLSADRFLRLETGPDPSMRHADIRTPSFNGMLPLALAVFLSHGLDVYDARSARDGLDGCLRVRVKSPRDTMFEDRKWVEFEKSLSNAILKYQGSPWNIPADEPLPEIDDALLTLVTGKDPEVTLHSDGPESLTRIGVFSNRHPAFVLRALLELTKQGFDAVFYRKSFDGRGMRYVIQGRFLQPDKFETRALKEVIHDIFTP